MGKKAEFHVQCKLQKGDQFQTSWIPVKYVDCETIRLKEGDTWEDGWKIIETGTMIPSDRITEMQKRHKNHRKATDV